ncbi:hypothetical protein Cgig2_005298 [Carnegiea gigantea]|uniref:Uncharacterized protein n=1 Tax=Carnegiea gigantea TaxID=171969 RepID=A0A9Q1K2H1_9CARY|nr:hypothetical protein Cgig2_005298 [Carnegiea gigantea]
MEVEELMKMVREITGTDMSKKKLWYSLKYDREMLVVVEGDSDVKVIFKGNDKHGYLYVAGNSGPMRRAQESTTICEGGVRDCDEEGGNNQVGKLMAYLLVYRNCRSLGSKGGGDTNEISDDDEIYVASEDAGDEETTKEDDVGDEQAAEKRCKDGNKRKGSADGNDVNDNVWPRSVCKPEVIIISLAYLRS